MVDVAERFWLDGAMVRWAEQGRTSLLSHTLHYGLGAFEGIRAYARASGETSVFRLREHVERLFDSCRLVLIEPRVTPDDVEAGCLAVLRENGMTEGYLRPVTYLGEGAMGLLPADNPPSTFIVAWKWGAYLGEEGLAKGVRCKIASHARHHVNVAFPRGKLIGQYINSIAAKQEARLAGYDEAILLDVHGHVSEASGENLFLVRKGRLKTPPLSSSVLPGITRDTILVLAREQGLVVEEAIVTRDELYLADEVFLTGTAAEVTPVREVDGRIVGGGAVGPVTQELQARYFDIVRGSDDTHPEWLTRV
jgi:branched-chain amino acid aminotransferase